MTGLLSALAGGGMIAALAYAIGWARGFRRGRELERMELPRDGELYFADGPVWPVEADSAAMAMERVARINGRAW